MQVGKHGSAPCEFDHPRAMRIDKLTGHVYIIDTNNSRIQVWDENLDYLTQFGKGILHYPRAITIIDGNIFVTDFFKDFLYKFSLPNYVLIKSKLQDKPLPKLHNPTAIDDENNELFVLEADKRRILVFTENLEFLRSLAKGVINVAFDLQVKQGIIHVLEVDTNLIQLLNSQNGQLIASVLTNHNSMSFYNACHFSLNPETNQYYITDWKLNKVKIISGTGAFIRIIDTSYYQCLQPRGIVSYPNKDIIITFQEGKNALAKLPTVFSTD
ncbi:PEP-CTERM domain protein [Oopsacas minuta]|uniref:PEP-CTERM domain protein n=1 Tax=Oopsacas minuta TaxID=111878 RepID=A0AAV7JXW3_9METZ|nr:PEP-CTERM domain protein [Oopsacas minuta]